MCRAGCMGHLLVSISSASVQCTSGPRTRWASCAAPGCGTPPEERYYHTGGSGEDTFSCPNPLKPQRCNTHLLVLVAGSPPMPSTQVANGSDIPVMHCRHGPTRHPAYLPRLPRFPDAFRGFLAFTRTPPTCRMSRPVAPLFSGWNCTADTLPRLTAATNSPPYCVVASTQSALEAEGVALGAGREGGRGRRGHDSRAWQPTPCGGATALALPCCQCSNVTAACTCPKVKADVFTARRCAQQ